MEVEHILLNFGVILGAGLLAQLVATFLRIPEMIVLVAVGAIIGPSVLGLVSGRWTRTEIIFLSWCRYTGVIPAAVASILLAEGVEGAEVAVSLVALAVVATLLLQATTAGVAARRLGLIEDPTPDTPA